MVEEKILFNTDAFDRQISGVSTGADSTCQWAEASQTLIFLDWDDTLFPTSELFDSWCLPKSTDDWCNLSLTQEQEECLDRWQDALLVYLRNTCAVSKRVVIVTNAQPGWVESCVSKFGPKLKQLFSQEDGPRVVYANATLKSAKKRSPAWFRGNPTLYSAEITEEEMHDHFARAKFYAMQQEAKEFYSQYHDQTWKNIISVGDAAYEHSACQDLTFRRRGPNREIVRTKCIVTPVQPPIRDMIYRLSVAALLWPVYVAYDGDMDVDMNHPEQLRAIARALDMHELGPVMRSFPIKEGEQEAYEKELDEMAVLIQQRIMEWASGA